MTDSSQTLPAPQVDHIQPTYLPINPIPNNDNDNIHLNPLTSTRSKRSRSLRRTDSQKSWTYSYKGGGEMDYPVARLYSRTRHTNGRDITHEEEGSDHEFGRVEEEGERERDGRVGEGRGEKEENEDETVEDWRSWVVLFGCFMLVGTTYGWGLSFGAFQPYYESDPRFGKSSPAVIALVGGLFSFFCLSFSFVGGQLGDRFGFRKVILGGLTVVALSQLGMAFCTEIWHLLIVQSVICGAAMGLSNPLYLAIPMRVFDRHRGLAVGLAGGGSGLIGSCETLLARHWLAKWGFKYTMIAFAGMHAVTWVGAGSLLLLRGETGKMPVMGTRVVDVKKDKEGEGNYPIASLHGAAVGIGKVPTRGDVEDVVAEGDVEGEEKSEGKVKERWTVRRVWRGLREGKRMLLLVMSIFVSQFGFLAPYFFIISFTKEKFHIDGTLATWPLFCMNIMGFFGRATAGQVADKLTPPQAYAFYLTASGLLQIVAWPLAKSYGGVIAFCLAYGSVAPCFLSLAPLVAAGLMRRKGKQGSIVGLCMMTSAPGQLAGASLDSAIFKAAGNNWLAMQLFAGAVQTMGGLLSVWLVVSIWRQERAARKTVAV